VTPSTLIGTVMVEFGQSPTTPVAMKIAQRWLVKAVGTIITAITRRNSSAEDTIKSLDC
jgi:hypothetical protein